MNGNTEYIQVGSRVYTTLDAMQRLVEVVEVRFTWGTGNEGIVTLPTGNATKEKIKEAIQKHIALFES